MLNSTFSVFLRRSFLFFLSLSLVPFLSILTYVSIFVPLTDGNVRGDCKRYGSLHALIDILSNFLNLSLTTVTFRSQFPTTQQPH